MDRTTDVAQFIVDEFAPDIDARELDPDYDLLESGIVDSLGVLTVLAWVEDRFGVEIDVGEIDEDQFRSVRAICARAGSAERAPQATLS
jgi:acyl carrier protein